MMDKEMFTNILLNTRREGIENVVSELEELGFFKAPASSKHHLAHEGGLLDHSLNVYQQAKMIAEVQKKHKPEIADKVTDDSIAIAALLHDVCKSNVYKTEKRNRKNAEGKWEQYDAFVPKYDYMPLGHGEKSVIMLLQMGLKLTNDEIFAIRWHMANWDMSDTMEAKGNFHAAVSKCPLLAILIAADNLATWITEA